MTQATGRIPTRNTNAQPEPVRLTDSAKNSFGTASNPLAVAIYTQGQPINQSGGNLLVDVQNFAIGQFGGQDTTAANLTSSLAFSETLWYNPATNIWERARTETVFRPQNAVAIAAETTVWTPAAGKKFRITGGILASSVAGNIVLRDNTAGTIFAVIPTLAGEPISFTLKNGYLSSAINNVLTATGPAASTLSGTFWGTEE